MFSFTLPLPLSTTSITPNQTHHFSSSSYLPLPPPHSTPQIQQWCSSSSSNQSITLDPPIQPRRIRYRLSQLCRDGQPHVARHLFDSIPQPKTVLWNTIIIGYVCNGFHDEALLLYTLMKSTSDTNCDFYTYSAVLKACAETQQFEMGKAVHGHVLRSHSHLSRIVSNSLLNMYVSCLSPVDDDEMGFQESDDWRHDMVCKVFNAMPRRNVVAWNTIISWYVKNKRYPEAVRHFWMMMKMGIKVSAVTFVNVFPAVSRMGNINRANAFYGLLLRLGNEFVNDSYVVSSAIFMYAELGCLDFARKVFDTSSERNIEVWNTMIGGYVQNNHPVEAISLFLEALKSEEAVVDEVTFLSALTAVSQLQRLDYAHQLHAYLIKSASLLSTLLVNAVIVMYSRCSAVETSFEIFGRMKDRDSVSWNTMISAFVQNGMDGEGLMLVYEMQKQGFMVDSVTVGALLSAASNLRDQAIGKQTHAYILRHYIQFEGMESYLVDMYSKSGLIETAQRLFENYHTHGKDEATWNAMIAGNTQNGRSEEAFAIFKEMLGKKVCPNAVTLASVLPACHPVGSLAFGKQLHGFGIRNLLNHNVFVVSALVDMYSKCGAISYAENVFATSTEKNSVIYTTMILAYGQHELGEKAISTFHSMRESGIKPDAIALVALLSSCSYAGLVDEGLQIFESMEREYGIRPSYEHYCCIADMLARAGRLVEAYEFVKDLGEEGNSVGIWGNLLAACKAHGEFGLAKTIARKLLRLEKGKIDTGYQVLLSNMYAEEGNWEYVSRVGK